jgi:hypothetical protein
MGPSRQGVSLTERMLANTTTPLVGVDEQLPNIAYLDDVAPDAFSRHLALLVNTYYRAAQPGSIGAFFGGLPANVSQYGRDFAHRPLRVAEADAPAAALGQGSAEWCPFFCTRSAPATLTQAEQVYCCNKLWLALLFTSASVLLAFACAASVLDRRTYVPDMLSYVASMTYNNPYLQLPAESSELEAMDRARALRNEKVYIGDVLGGRDVGNIAFAKSGGMIRRLEKGRKYT